MRKFYLVLKILLLLFILNIFLSIDKKIIASNNNLISSVEDLNNAIQNAESGDTIYVDDIKFDYNYSPNSIFVINKSITIKSGKVDNAVFSLAMLSIYGSDSSNNMTKVKFENISFEGDIGWKTAQDLDINISSKLPNVLKTMCSFLFDRNVDAYFSNCNFNGYHYGYGGVFSATRYSKSDNKYKLNLNLENCNFSNNYSHHGGVIYLYGYDSDCINLSATKCSFIDNYGTTGGTIFAMNARINLSECIINNNKFIDYDIETKKCGGALALYNCDTSIDGCVISRNESNDSGAAIYAEISPFKTLKIRNTTMIGNSSSTDGGLYIGLGKTNFTTPAKVYISTSTIFGVQSFNDNVSIFGSLLSGDKEEQPSFENNFNRTLSNEVINERNYNDEDGHLSIMEDELMVDSINYPHNDYYDHEYVKSYIGDNYQKDSAVRVKIGKNKYLDVIVNYGEKIELPIPTRNGYKFCGWKNYNDFIYLGGELNLSNISPIWKFNVLEHWYIFVFIFIVVLFIICFLIYLLKKNENKSKSLNSINKEENQTNIHWIDNACNNPEIIKFLSARELDVFRELLKGESRKEIAGKLYISEATVKKHCSNIYEKFNVKNRNELVSKIISEY